MKIKLQEWWRKNWVLVIISAIFIALIVIMAGLDCFNQPVGDDYMNVLNVRKIAAQMEADGENASLPMAALKRAGILYDGWQGTWFSNFWFYMSPLYYSINAFKVGVFILQLFWVLSIFYFFLSLRKIGKVTKRQAIIASMVAFICSLCLLYDQAEGIFWYTGAIMYLMPFSLSLIWMGLILRFEYKAKLLNIIPLFIVTICLGGVSFMTGLFVGLILGILTIRAFIKKKNNKWLYLMFLIGFVVAFGVNVFAPGNSVRAITNDLPLKTRLVHTTMISIAVSFDMIKHALFETILIPITILAVPFMIGIIKRTKTSFDHIILIPMLALGIFISLFTPTAYAQGYYDSATRIENIQLFYFVILFELVVFYIIGHCYSNKKSTLHKVADMKYYVAGTLALAVSLIAVDVNRLSVFEMISDLTYDTARQYNNCISSFHYEVSQDPIKAFSGFENCEKRPNSFVLVEVVDGDKDKLEGIVLYYEDNESIREALNED